MPATAPQQAALPTEGGIREYAAAYLAAGWSLIPIKPLDKRPLVKWEPYQDERATMQQVEAWLRQWPDMNLGLVTGRISGVGVLDIDGEAGVRALRDAGQRPPPTLLQKTPHGWHAVYKLTGRPVKTAAGVLPHVDTRGDGGYIVVAPSRLQDGAYRWHHLADPAPAPEWLAQPERLQTPPPPPPQRAAADAPDWVRQALANGVGKGLRNATATRLVGYFHSRRLPGDVILTLLEPFAARCEPPIDQRELGQIVQSVARYAVQARDVGVDTPPVRIETGDGYRYEWDTIGIRCDFRALHSEREGINAELVIESAIPGTPRRVYGPVRFNLLSVNTRTALCNALAKRVENVAWDRLVDDASRLTVEGYRSGEPLVLLRDAAEPLGDGWLIPPLIMEDGPTLWFAQGGSGKSWLSLIAAASISSGEDYGLGSRPTMRKRVALLDWEWDAYRHKRRLRGLLGETGLRECDVLHRHCDAPLADMAGDLRRLLVQEEVGFVIVDSVVPACGGEPEMAQPTRDFFAALRSLKVGSLLIAHNNKGGDEEKPYGNVFWFNESRCIWYVAKKQETGAGEPLHVGLLNRKSNDGGLFPAMAYRIDFADGAVTVEPEDAATVDGIREKLPKTAQALALVDGRALSAKELAAELEVSEQQVRVYMARAERRGQVVKLADPALASVRWIKAARSGEPG